MKAAATAVESNHRGVCRTTGMAQTTGAFISGTNDKRNRVETSQRPVRGTLERLFPQCMRSIMKTGESLDIFHP